MRHTELEEGIDVLDSNGNIVGSSRIAAKHVRTCDDPGECTGGLEGNWSMNPTAAGLERARNRCPLPIMWEEHCGKT